MVKLISFKWLFRVCLLRFGNHSVMCSWKSSLFLFFSRVHLAVHFTFDSNIFLRVSCIQNWLTKNSTRPTKITAFPRHQTVWITKQNLSNGIHRRATDTTNTKPYNNHHHSKMKAKFELVLVRPPKKKKSSDGNEKCSSRRRRANAHVCVCKGVWVCVDFFWLRSTREKII